VLFRGKPASERGLDQKIVLEIDFWRRMIIFQIFLKGLAFCILVTAMFIAQCLSEKLHANNVSLKKHHIGSHVGG